MQVRVACRSRSEHVRTQYIYTSLKPHPDIYLKARSGAGRPPRVPAVHVAPLSTWHRNIETAQYTACKETIRDYDGTCPWGGEQSPHGCADGRLGDYTTKKALDAGFDCVTCDQKGGQTPPLPRPPPHTHKRARRPIHPRRCRCAERWVHHLLRREAPHD